MDGVKNRRKELVQAIIDHMMEFIRGEYKDELASSLPNTNYSYNEKVIGTWVDGKTLYQKTYRVEHLVPGEDQVVVEHGIKDVDFIFVNETIFYDPNDGFTGSWNVGFSTYVDPAAIYVNRPDEGGDTTAHITLRYTKIE